MDPLAFPAPPLEAEPRLSDQKMRGAAIFFDGGQNLTGSENRVHPTTFVEKGDGIGRNDISNFQIAPVHMSDLSNRFKQRNSGSKTADVLVYIL